MFGTALATSPIMSSNYIGTRVFTLGVYLDVFVEDQFPMIQNNLLVGGFLKIDPVTVGDNIISQNHVFTDEGLLSEYFTSASPIHQQHIMAPLGQYTTSDVTDPIQFNQNHIMISIGSYTTSDITDLVQFNQNHIMISSQLDLDPVKVGKPFVNPSIRRVISATAVSDNVTLLTVNKENSVVILNSINNRYK